MSPVPVMPSACSSMNDMTCLLSAKAVVFEGVLSDTPHGVLQCLAHPQEGPQGTPPCVQHPCLLLPPKTGAETCLHLKKQWPDSTLEGRSSWRSCLHPSSHLPKAERHAFHVCAATSVRFSSKKQVECRQQPFQLPPLCRC